jgi:hypothetical protein
MALTDYSIDTSGTPEDVQRRQKLAEALMQQGSDTSPAAGGKNGGWLTAMNRGLAGALGGYREGQARQEDQTNRAQANAQLVALLGGGSSPQPAPMGSIAAQGSVPQSAAPTRLAPQANNADLDETPAPAAQPVAPPGASSGMPTFGADGKMMGNLTDNIGQPPAAPPAAPGANPAMAAYVTNPYGNKAVQSALLTKALTPHDQFVDKKDADGNWYQENLLTHQKTMIKGAEASPSSVREFEYGQTHPGFTEAQLAKTKAGAAQLNNQNNIDMNSGQTYDKQIAEGLGKAHASLSNGVEDAQARARDLAAMQGAVDAIQKNGGTTGGMGQAQILELKKTLNSGAAGLGITTPFDEKDISDKEFLTKFNRQIAGAQAKNAVGSRVTNFEMSNYLKANPGLEMSGTGNQRLIGIQSQIEQRNIAVGNAIRNETAKAISQGKKIDPVTVQKIISDYDEVHHIKDPMNGQDLTQSYTLPEFQNSGANAALAGDHSANMKKLGAKTYQKIDGQWHQVD